MLSCKSCPSKFAARIAAILLVISQAAAVSQTTPAKPPGPTPGAPTTPAKSEFKFTPLNSNALTPADKNWGNTSFTLVDKLGSQKAKGQAVPEAVKKQAAASFSDQTVQPPSNAIIIDS